VSEGEKEGRVMRRREEGDGEGERRREEGGGVTFLINI